MTKKILVLNGKVVDVQEKEFPVAPALTWHDYSDDSVKIGWDFADGVASAVVQPEPSWEERRRAAYPSWGDQLDMQYHDKVDGTSTWQDAVQAVKDANPKP